MFWIVGGDALFGAIAALSASPAVKAVCAQVTDHVEWEGFRFYDMIFPLFLFIIGVALPFSIGRRLEAGESRRSVFAKVLRRTTILFAIGLVYNGILHFDGWDHIRFFGVLQRQAIGYGAAATLLIYTKPKTQAIVGVSILFVYWAILALIPVPGHSLGSMDQWGNVPNYVDRLILAPHQMYEKYGDPEGPVSMIPAVSTALLGVFAGYWLRSARPPERKALGLFVAGLVCLALGLAWMPFFPVIKKIWTSSYVLVAGGASLELLALFYYLVDVRGWTRWAFPFIVIGMNPLTIYLLSEIVDFTAAASYFVGGAAKFVPVYKNLILAAAALTVKWLFLYFLYRQKVFLRV